MRLPKNSNVVSNIPKNSLFKFTLKFTTHDLDKNINIKTYCIKLGIQILLRKISFHHFMTKLLFQT